MSTKIRLQKRPNRSKKYFTYSINLPKKVLDGLPAFKRARFVYLDVDLLGNIVIKTKRFL